MLLPFAFVLIAGFVVLAIVLIIRRSKGKKELNRDVVSEDRMNDTPPDGTGTNQNVDQS